LPDFQIKIFHQKGKKKMEFKKSIRRLLSAAGAVVMTAALTISAFAASTAHRRKDESAELKQLPKSKEKSQEFEKTLDFANSM